MSVWSLFTRRGRTINKTKKLLNNPSLVVNVENLRQLLEGFKVVYLDPSYRSNLDDKIINMYFKPEVLITEFEKASRMILEEEQPDRRRYIPKLLNGRVKAWLWDNNDLKLEYEEYFPRLITAAEKFLILLRDDYETEGKAVANYRLEQMYYQLCDIVTITEAIYIH